MIHKSVEQNVVIYMKEINGEKVPACGGVFFNSNLAQIQADSLNGFVQKIEQSSIVGDLEGYAKANNKMRSLNASLNTEYDLKMRYGR